MAIIQPARVFQGSNINNNLTFKYIKEGVKQVQFNQKENKDGAFLYILPPYKSDRDGNGVWFKAIDIRDNFGDKFKEKYVVNPSEPDPVAYFERQFKINFPEDAKVIDEVGEGGQTRKKYPNYGRKTKRVIYNVAYVQNLKAGNHILDLPSFGAASQIQEWHEGTDAKGRPRPMVNDPNKSIPIFVKLKMGGIGNPWQVQIESGDDPAVLPESLADSDELYNLDTDIFEYRTTDELLSKLRDMYATHIFDTCIDGFNSGSVSVSTYVHPAKATPSVVQKVVASRPVVETPEDDQIPMERHVVDDDEVPVLSNQSDLKRAAAEFLRKKQGK